MICHKENYYEKICTISAFADQSDYKKGTVDVLISPMVLKNEPIEIIHEQNKIMGEFNKLKMYCTMIYHYCMYCIIREQW